ncbi:MAG: carbohydrate ABC transporter permease [Candidatus Izemoplasmatales bacterium]|jgi:ABC-type sugar transport system permease subunit
MEGIKQKKKFFRHDEKVAYTMLAIPLLWWCIFFLYAFLRAVYFSFTDLSVDISQISQFNLNNYIRLVKDATFWKAMGNTLLWTAVMTIFNNIFGLFVAFLITRLKKGQKIFLTLLFWPTLASAVTSADITKLIFSPSDSGIMNSIIQFFGGNSLAWYNDEKLSLFSLMLIPALFGFSTQMVIYYVAIKGVDKGMVEAAQIDGATPVQILLKIYIPSIMPAITYNLIISIIGGIKVIAPMQLVSNGGPLDSSMSIMLYMYQNTTVDMGYACSIGIITLLIIMGITMIQLKLTKKEGRI